MFKRITIPMVGLAFFASAAAVSLTATPVHATDCVTADQASYQHTFNGTAGTATVSLKDGQNLCSGETQDFTLVSYKTQSNGSFEQTLPQYLASRDSDAINSAVRSIALNVNVPDCYFQTDLVFGTDTPSTINKSTFGRRILGHPNLAPGNTSQGPWGAIRGGNKACTTTAAQPTATAAAGVCVVPGSTTGVISGSITNTSDATKATASYTLTAKNSKGDVVKNVVVSNLDDGKTAAYLINGLAAGSYSIAVAGSDGTSSSAGVTVAACDVPQPCTTDNSCQPGRGGEDTTPTPPTPAVKAETTAVLPATLPATGASGPVVSTLATLLVTVATYLGMYRYRTRRQNS